MAISRAQLLKELLPGLNALFGLEYARYGEEHKEIYETEKSERSFEEETKLSGFSAAPVKNEGSAIAYDNAQEAFTARYNHETIALGFSITEEAVEDNLYDSLSARYTKGLARAMAYTKQVKAAAVLNNGFTNSAAYYGGDGVPLFSTAHPLVNGGTNSNRPTTGADLNETSLEAAVIQIAQWVANTGTRRVITEQRNAITTSVVAIEAVVQNSGSLDLLGVRHRTSQSLGVTSRQRVVQVIFHSFFGDREALSNGFVGIASGEGFLSVVGADGSAFGFHRGSTKAGQLGFFFKATIRSFGFVDLFVLFAVTSVFHTEQGVQAGQQLFKELGT